MLDIESRFLGFVQIQLCRCIDRSSYSFFNLGARCEWVVNAMSRPLYPRERDPVPNVQEAGWDPETVWTGAENLANTGI